MQYAGGTTLKKKIVGEMQMYTRRGGNGCVGVWCICDQTTGASLGSIALLPLPTDKDDTDWGQLIEDQLPASEIEIGYFGNGPLGETAMQPRLLSAYCDLHLRILLLGKSWPLSIQETKVQGRCAKRLGL